MATVIVNHKVKDYTIWKAGYDSDKARRDASGAREIAVGEKMGDPGNVYLVFEVADISSLEKMMADPELQQRMQEFGVISQPEAVVIG